MAKEQWAGELASRGDDATLSAAANTITNEIDYILQGRRTGWAKLAALSQVLLAVSLILSLLVWLPTQAWSQSDHQTRSPKAQFDKSGGQPAADAWMRLGNGNAPADYMAYLRAFPDSRLVPQAGLTAERQPQGDIVGKPAYRAEPAVLRTNDVARLNDSVRQDLYDNFDRRHEGEADKERQLHASVSTLARASRKVASAAAVVVPDTLPRLAEKVAAPTSAVVLPLVRPSGPSGATMVTSLSEFLALPRIKTGLLLLHLLGLVLGLGTATLLDLFIARILYAGRFSKEEFEFICFAAGFVFAGILLLWISGLSFLLYYYFENPTGLENPKVWAKISIVAMLSLNGLYIHKQVLPELRRNAGFSIFHGTSKVKRSMMLVSGAVSLVSWYAPLVIGTAKELNFTVSAPAILVAYAVALALAILASHVLYALLVPRDPSTPQAAMG